MAEPSPWALKRKAAELGPPLMQSKAKAGTPSTAQNPSVPLTKASIAKVPPSGKAPVAKMPPSGKAPIAKRPPPAGTVSPSFAKRPPPAMPPTQAAEALTKAPPPSPAATPSPEASPSRESGAVSRKSSWQDFSNSDPLYALLGELGENKVTSADNKVDEERVIGYFERLCEPGVAKPKDWIEVWAAMDIPVTIENHAMVVQHIIEVVSPSELGDTVGEILAELVKGHRAKVKAVEQAITTIFECGCDEKDCVASFLLLIFPKSPTSDWGWSRVGWSWKEWWGIADKIFAVLEPSGAFEALRSLLSSLETDSGTYLPHQQIWDEKRLTLVRSALCKYGGLQEDELAAAVDVSLS